ncbi:MAG: proteasome subunit beta [Candidatus Helarchaeota archaeon]
MTTTIGVKYKDGIILAADRQVSSENFVASKMGEKIYQVDKTTGVTISGLVADAYNLVERLKAEFKLYYYEKKRPISIEHAARLASNIFYGVFRGGRPLYAQVLIGGFSTNTHGQLPSPKLFVIDPSGGTIEDKFIATGSGSQVAYGTLENYYKEDLSEKEAIQLAFKALRSSIERNPYTGNGSDVVVISRDGYRRLTDAELLTIVNEVSHA